MSNAVVYISFSLIEGASVSDFLLAAEKLNSEFMSQQNGYISWKLLVEGDTWADVLTWETMEAAQNAMEAGCSYPLSGEYFSFLNQESVKTHMYSIKTSN